MRFLASYTVLSLMVLTASGTGQFYVGILGAYNITGNNHNCDDSDTCFLPVEIQISGFNSSTDPLTRWTSFKREAESFAAESERNPVTFQFHRWPGELNVTVNIYSDNNLTVLVDTYSKKVVLHSSNEYYLVGKLEHESQNNSTLTVAYRYSCDPTTGPPCFTDCVDHDENDTCPVNVNPTEISPDVITFTGFTDPKCHTTNEDGYVLAVNCSDVTFPTHHLRENDTNTENLNNTTTVNTTTATHSTRRLFLDDGTTPKTITTPNDTQNGSTDSAKNRSQTAKKPQSTHGPDIITSTSDVPIKLEQHPESKTAFWAAIVGGVLGGVALFAAAGFLCYWNRQKKMQKRQEIYNVNPKILRNFEEFEENGTSGRSDVPMETEQY